MNCKRQRFPGFDRFENIVYRAIEEALVLCPSASANQNMMGSKKSTGSHLGDTPRIDGFASVDMKVIGDMHRVIVIGYAGLDRYWLHLVPIRI